MKRKKRNIFTLIALVIILVLGPVALLRKIKTTKATWYNESWMYRTAITISNTGSADSNKKVKFDIDTATLYSAGKIKINCDDSRFTDINGNLLDYYLDSANGACNTNSTDYYVLVPTINAGTTTLYHYYGNPSATKGSKNSQFSQATFTQNSTTTNSEEQSPGPVAYWSFDEGTGSTVYDSTSNKNNGTLGAGAAAPTWQTEDMCVSGKCLKFDGGDDYVNTNKDFSWSTSDSFTIGFWLKPNSVTGSQGILGKGQAGGYGTTNWEWSVRLTNSTIDFVYWDTAGSGLIITSSSQPLPLNQWSYITITYDPTNKAKMYMNTTVTATDTNVSGTLQNRSTPVLIGHAYYNSGTNYYFNGFIDDVKIYPYARTAAQIKTDYNAGKVKAASSKGVAVGLGSAENQGDALSNGLVGYWNFNNGSGTTAPDLSGNSNTATLGTGNSAPGWVAGMYGIGLSFDGSDFITVNDNANLTPSSEITVSVWANKISGSQGTILGKASSTTNFSYALYFWTDNKIYWEISQNGNTSGRLVFTTTNTFSASTWYHITGTFSSGTIKLFVNGTQQTGTTTGTASAINDNSASLLIGRILTDTNYWMNGKIDDVRIYNRALSPAEVRQLADWAPGPVAYWNFDGTSIGTSVPDISGYGNNGGWNGTGSPRWVTGKYGKAGKFNGSNDYVGATPVGSTLNTPGGLTASAWIYPDSVTSSSDQGIISKWDVGIADGWFIEAWQSGLNWRLYFVFEDDTTYSWTPAITITQNQWSHFSLTYDKNYFRVYINGVLASTSSNYTKNLKINTRHLRVGLSQGTQGSSHYWDGSIDDVRIYNYARTQKQIVEDMNAGHPAVGSPVGSAVAYYKFDEGYGTTANNSGSQGSTLNGTITGASWNNDGKFGKTLNFDGTDDVVTVTNSTAIDLNNNLASGFSFSGWFNADSVGEGSSGQMFWKGNSTYLRVSGQSGANLNIDASVDLTTDATRSLTTPITTNAWNHIVMAWTDDSDDELTIWVNGKNMGSSTNGDGAPAAESNNLLIGGTTTANFDGKIDDFKVYSYELTEDEVKLEYNRGAAMVLGTLSSGAGNTAPSGSAGQEYCVPGDTASCLPPVARWDFNEGVGTSAFDTSGNGNNGGLGAGTAAPSWVHGKIGKALKFDGSNDYLDLGTKAAWDLTTYTITGWFKTSDKSRFNVITSKNISSTNRNWWITIWQEGYGTHPDGSLAFRTSSGGVLNVDISSGANNADGLWHFFAAVLNGTTEAKLYVDGILNATQSNPGAPNTPSTPAIIGNGPEVSGRNFNGLIDQVRIYNYARSPAQIAWDYNRGAPVAQYDFDECQGGIAHDSAADPATGGTREDGTITIGASGTQSQLGTCAVGTGTTAAWGNGSVGKYSASLNFDGTDDYVSVGTGFTAQSVSLWVKPTSNTSNLMQLNASANITASSGLISATGFSTPTIYVNGIASTTLTADAWQMVTVTTGTGISATTIRLGLVGSNYYAGQIDDVRIYNYALTSAQVKLLYNAGAAVQFAPVTGVP